MIQTLLWIGVIILLLIAIMEVLSPNSINEGFEQLVSIGDSPFWSRFVPRRGDVGNWEEERGFVRDDRYFHGYADIYIHGKWVKATPSFNIELCNKAGIKPLDFDGHNSSLFHEYDIQGRMHMEYVKQRGEFFDIPYEDLIYCWKENYPMLQKIGGITELNGNFNNEIIKVN